MTPARTGGSLIGRIGSYLQIVSKDPGSTAFVPLAEAYRQIGLLDDALEAARLGTRRLPHFAPGFASMGRVLGQMGRLDESMSAYAKALSIDRQSQSALVGLARLHLIRGERDQARRILLQASEFHPDDDRIRDMLNALDLPRPWAEIKQAVQALEVQPQERTTQDEDEAVSPPPIPTATLAEIYAKQGLRDKALAVYRGILAQTPDNEAARARIAELSEQEPAATPPVAVSAGGEAPVAQPGEAPAAVVEDAVEQGVTTTRETVVARDRSPLAVLQRWLHVIKQGRADVQ
jgi:tetratricopeptide (TPR) repeat protein